MNNPTKGLLIALAAAGLFGSAAAKAVADAPPAASKNIHCLGLNECKGKGTCASANNECAGKNTCKGKGVLMMPAEECTKKGGTNLDAKK